MKNMNQQLLLLILVLFIFSQVKLLAQDTFSIVAVDTVTGEIGSAGASCIAGSYILSDVIEGIGAIHTQAYWNLTNKQNAHNRMLEGLSPQQIIDWLVANDAQNNPTIRQYGIVDLTRNGESAAYTGVNCDDYKNHVTGPGYAIQGNILLEQIIIDTMHTTFLNTAGPLADRLMATLQAAKIPGADTRCAQYGKSSISGFVKIVRIGDGSNPYLQIVVSNTPTSKDPIDSLQTLFDNWKQAKFNIVDPFLSQITVEPDTLPANGTSQALITITPKNNSDTLLASGLQILLLNTGAGLISAVNDLGNGIYEATITSPIAVGTDTISAKVISGSDTISIFRKAVVVYTNPTSVKEESIQPDKYYLYQNTPNPFNPSTIIIWQSPVSSWQTLKVYDLLGREVAVLVDEYKPAGKYEVEFNADNLPSGIYFYTINAGGFIETKKMVLIK